MHRELIGEAPGAHIIRVTDPCKPLEIDLSRPLEIRLKLKLVAARGSF